MTWNVGQGMGLTINWSDQMGLTVDPAFGMKTNLEMERGGDNDLHRRYTAKVANFPVKVGSESIDNASEPYPLLEFRDISYFPMTWHFADESFNWKTAWDDRNGLSITTWQIPYFSSIIYDDDTSLYVSVGVNGFNGLFRVAKDMKGIPAFLNQDEAAVIWEKQTAQKAQNLQSDPNRQVEQKDDSLVFDGIELLSHDAKPNESRFDQPEIRSSVYPLGDNDVLVSIRIFRFLNIPAPYTPHDDLLFRVRDGKAKQVEGFDQAMEGLQKTANGYWVWSYSPNMVLASNDGTIGTIAWIGNDGLTRSWNELLGVQFLAGLDVNGDDMIAQAYNLIGEDLKSKPHGYYRLHQDGTYEKIMDTEVDDHPNIAYATADHQLFVQGTNSLTNVLTGQSRTWWDYELWEAAGHPKISQ